MCREIAGVRGLTREVVNALCANIESREWRRIFLQSHGLPPANPRSATSDDVECFFSVLRESVGKDFTVKEVCSSDKSIALPVLLSAFIFVQVYYMWRKACVEYSKRSDPSLPFYYFSTSDRFYEGSLPSFDEVPERQRQLRRAPRREQPGANVGRRITMATRGSGSLRAIFHNLPVDLPPPPGSCVTDHTYASSGP